MVMDTSDCRLGDSRVTEQQRTDPSKSDRGFFAGHTHRLAATCCCAELGWRVPPTGTSVMIEPAGHAVYH